MKNEDLKQKILNQRRENTVESLIGLLATVVFSKRLFNRNSDIEVFLKEVFNLEYLPYVIRSRTNIFARLSKDLLNDEKLNIQKTSSMLGKYFEIDEKTIVKNKNTKNISKWIQGIRNEQNSDE